MSYSIFVRGFFEKFAVLTPPFPETVQFFVSVQCFLAKLTIIIPHSFHIHGVLENRLGNITRARFPPQKREKTDEVIAIIDTKLFVHALVIRISEKLFYSRNKYRKVNQPMSTSDYEHRLLEQIDGLVAFLWIFGAGICIVLLCCANAMNKFADGYVVSCRRNNAVAVNKYSTYVE